MRKYGPPAVFLAIAIALFFYVHEHSSGTLELVPSRVKASEPLDSVGEKQQLVGDSEGIPSPTVIADELASLKPGTTVGEWRKAHSADEWHQATYADYTNAATSNEQMSWMVGHDCGVFLRNERLANGDDLVRKAVFYLPAPPSPIELPGQTPSPSSLIDACTLGYIQTDLTPTSESVRSIDDEVRSRLTERFGAPTDEPDEMATNPGVVVGAGGEARKELIPVWRMRDSKIAIGSTLFPMTKEAIDIQSSFSAHAYLPLFRYEMRERPDDLDPMDADHSPEIFQLAVSRAALANGIQQPFMDIYRRWLAFNETKIDFVNGYSGYSELAYKEDAELPRPIRTSDVEDVLRRWLEASQNLPPQRRAAALLAAYFLVETTWNEFPRAAVSVPGEVTEDQKNLEAAGVEFRDDVGGREPTVNWVQEALKLDPDGPIGDAITLMILSGWRFDDFFDGDFRDVAGYVIAQAEKYLARPHEADFTARAEYFLASAYCDRAVISEIGDEEGDEGKPAPPTREQIDRGPISRTEALKHYRLALAAGGKSKTAVAAWRTGWRLMAGLPVLRRYRLPNE